MAERTPDAAGNTLADAFSGSWPRRVALALLLVYVLAAPFPWGSVQPGVTGTGKITAGAFLIALLAFLSPDVRLRARGALLPVATVAGVALLGLVQLAPLPLESDARARSQPHYDRSSLG